jgi:hypothetical protein
MQVTVIKEYHVCRVVKEKEEVAEEEEKGQWQRGVVGGGVQAKQLKTKRLKAVKAVVVGSTSRVLVAGGEEARAPFPHLDLEEPARVVMVLLVVAAVVVVAPVHVVAVVVVVAATGK